MSKEKQVDHISGNPYAQGVTRGVKDEAEYLCSSCANSDLTPSVPVTVPVPISATADPRAGEDGDGTTGECNESEPSEGPDDPGIESGGEVGIGGGLRFGGGGGGGGGDRDCRREDFRGNGGGGDSVMIIACSKDMSGAGVLCMVSAGAASEGPAIVDARLIPPSLGVVLEETAALVDGSGRNWSSLDVECASLGVFFFAILNICFQSTCQGCRFKLSCGFSSRGTAFFKMAFVSSKAPELLSTISFLTSSLVTAPRTCAVIPTVSSVAFRKRMIEAACFLTSLLS